MIRNIFNWVGGGFFRTIGRFVAFIVLGAIAYILIGKSNIKITDLLGIETIYADTLKQQSYTQYSSASDLSDTLPTRAWYAYQYYTTSQYAQSNFVEHTFYLKSPIDVRQLKGNGKVTIPLFYEVPHTSANQNTDTIEGALYCRQFNAVNGIYTCQYTGMTDDSLIHDYEYIPTNIQLYALAFYDNGSFNYCQINGTTLECTIAQTQQGNYITNIRIYAKTYTPNITGSVEIGLSQLWSAWVTDSSIMQGEIQNQTQQQQQQHNETMSYIQDANITETNSTATSFFDNFTDTDHGGLSSIITAPLSTINNMLSNTCVAPSATWKGATITLPCGDLLWSRPGADGLRNLLNVFYGGFICYYAIRRLFFLIENLKDPTKDNLEVTDL